MLHWTNRKEIKEMASEETDEEAATREQLAAQAEAPRTPVHLTDKNKMFMGMVMERIYFFRSEKDAVALIPLLDIGAEVFGLKGNDAIQAYLELSWVGYEEYSYAIKDNGLDIADDGTGASCPPDSSPCAQLLWTPL